MGPASMIGNNLLTSLNINDFSDEKFAEGKK